MGIIEKLRRRHQTAFISVNPHDCVACWDCLRVCPRDVFGKIDFLGHRHIKIVRPDACIGCRKCVNVCGQGALRLRDGDASAVSR